MLPTKNGVQKFFKPFCCLVLLSGSSPPPVSIIETATRLRQELEKVKMEGE